MITVMSNPHSVSNELQARPVHQDTGSPTQQHPDLEAQAGPRSQRDETEQDASHPFPFAYSAGEQYFSKAERGTED